MLTWLASPLGRLVAAALLFSLIAVLERAPWVRGWLKGDPLTKRAVAIVVTVAGAAAAAFVAGVPLAQVSEAALTAFLAAAGLNAMTQRLPKSPSP